MFSKSETESRLDAEIVSQLKKLHESTDVAEYDKIVERIAKLHKLKVEEKPRPKQISPDTVLVVIANIAGILWLARYERENVIKSKSALGFVMRPR